MQKETWNKEAKFNRMLVQLHSSDSIPRLSLLTVTLRACPPRMTGLACLADDASCGSVTWPNVVELIYTNYIVITWQRVMLYIRVLVLQEYYILSNMQFENACNKTDFQLNKVSGQSLGALAQHFNCCRSYYNDNIITCVLGKRSESVGY